MDSGGGGGLELKEKVEQGLYLGHAYVLSFVPSTCDEKNNDRIVFWREYGRQGAGCSLSIPKGCVPPVEAEKLHKRLDPASLAVHRGRR